MSGHTPGPWHLREYSGGWQVMPDDNSRTIGDVWKLAFNGPDGQQRRADARLIAAAPEMLEALQAISGVAGHGLKPSETDWNLVFDCANAAIDKAVQP